MAPPPPTHFDRDEREVEFSRALAFSDGVFGIAITLLVVSIDVPDLRGGDLEGELVDALRDLLPSLASYFLSFAAIGLFWLRHHRLFSRIRRLDTLALCINLVLLAFIALMPFSTEIIGRYGDEPIAVSVYALNLAVAAAAYTWLWFHCTRAGLLDEDVAPSEMRAELAARSVVSLGFLASIPIAYALSPSAAQWFWIVPVLVQAPLARRYAPRG
ncbi:MAG TPA: TMEM175 family protein [Capillimicrobium sp.]|jgi:uncharacterized membrane protein